MPDVIVIAGPNGAGKSTLAPYLLRDTFGILEYVNADTIAQGLSAFSPDLVALEAGRVMLRRLADLAGEQVDFAFETTLAARSYATWLAQLRGTGYQVHIVFLWLNSTELAIERVAERVRAGGHSIPTDTIERRYRRGLENLFKMYLPVANSWQVYDASLEKPEVVAFGGNIGKITIANESVWKRIER